MSLISKFAVFLVLAGILAALFTILPSNQKKSAPVEKIKIQRVRSEVPEAQRPMKASSADYKMGESRGSATTEGKIFSSVVKVPAIRGVNNYGWVQLPRGTRVDFVRESGDGLWVRWDGTTVKVPHVVAATGAVVLR